VNDVNSRLSLVMRSPGDGVWFWGIGPAAGMRQCWLSSARRPGEHHGPGVEGAPGTGRNSDVWNVGTLSRSGRNDRLPVGSSAESVAGTGRLKKQMAAAERQQESGCA
jgi:hypothetical protein